MRWEDHGYLPAFSKNKAYTGRLLTRQTKEPELLVIFLHLRYRLQHEIEGIWLLHKEYVNVDSLLHLSREGFHAHHYSIQSLILWGSHGFEMSYTGRPEDYRTIWTGMVGNGSFYLLSLVAEHFTEHFSWISAFALSMMARPH